MPKPIVLAGGPLDRRIRVELAVATDPPFEKELETTRRALRSRALARLYLLVAAGKQGPTDLAAAAGKSKYAVSLQLSELRRAGLIRPLPEIAGDLRRRPVGPDWGRFAEIFRQDFAFELQVYQNRLLCEGLERVEGRTLPAELVLLGSGRLGLLRRVVPERAEVAPPHALAVQRRVEAVAREFTLLFEAYLDARTHATLREYLFGLYKELDASHRRLPGRSELAAFFRFLDASFSKMEPLDALWRCAARTKKTASEARREVPPAQVGEILFFEEAGVADPAGRYLLYPDAQRAIRPRTRLRVFPSFTFDEGG